MFLWANVSESRVEFKADSESSSMSCMEVVPKCSSLFFNWWSPPSSDSVLISLVCFCWPFWESALALAIESVPSVNPLRPFKFPILVGVFTVFLLLVSYLRMPRREARLCWWAQEGGAEGGRCRGRCPPEETKICILFDSWRPSPSKLFLRLTFIFLHVTFNFHFLLGGLSAFLSAFPSWYEPLH